MGLKYLLFTLVFILAVIQDPCAQNKIGGRKLQQKYCDYLPETNLSTINYFQEMSAAMGLSEDNEMNFISSFMGPSGSEHTRYQQYYKSIPVIGNVYILHDKDGNIKRATGLYTPDISLDILPAVTAKSAIDKSKQLLSDTINRNNTNIDHWKIEVINTPLLCIIDNSFPNSSGQMKLAYQIDMKCDYPLMKMRYYIDANNNRLIRSFPLIQEHGVPGTGKTKYYGTQNIIVDSLAPGDFILKDITRGKGITVKNNSGDLYHNNSKNWDLINAKKDEVAIDALYCAEKYFDLLLERFNWESIDGAGVPLNVKVHNNAVGVTNAYWDGNTANFGDGTCIRGPLTTMEVVGHEFTHGLIQYTSQLIYDSESGAINESIADMFGKSLEFYADPSGFSWDMGHSIHLKPGLLPFRKMDDPKQMGMPAFYKGINWTDDNEVHFNSSIGNLWFVILCDGRTGINEAGESFDVQGIGIEKAHRIIFLANNAYNISNTNYNQLVKNTLYAAEELFGINSPEWLGVKEAWKAVGLPGQASTIKKDLAITSPSDQFSTCEINDYLPLTIQVSNSGSETYDPSSNAHLSLYSLTNGIVTIPLTEEILPGESKTFEINNWIKYAGQDYESYNINVVYDDDYPDNNGSLIFIYYKQYEDKDLAVNISTTGTYACKGNKQKFIAGILNNSCNEIAAGEKFELNFRNENGASVWAKEVILDEAIIGSAYKYVEFETDLNFIGNKAYTIELDFDGDPDLSNNTSNIELSPGQSLESDYFQEFDNLPDGLAPLSIYSLYPFPTINYQGESYLGFTGYYPDTSIRERCGYPEEVFLNPQKLIASASICMNFPTAENVTVEFDAVLFKNQYNEDVDYPYSSMIQVSWEGNDPGSQLIYDQVDGVKVHHSIDLPPYYSGTLYFKFFTETGNLSINPFSMQTNDVILMDNLNIHTGTVSVNKNETGNKINIHPNPCTDYLILENPENIKIEQVKIVDIMGKEVMANCDLKNTINTSQLLPGVYFLKLMNNNSSVHTIKFSKM